MTWEEIKIITLQRMFSISGDELTTDDITLPYIKSMPGAANEALQLLSTAGKYIVKSLEIKQDGSESGGVKRYDLSKITDDFYSFKENEIYFSDGESYGKTYDYSIESNNVLILKSGIRGTWTVYYNAYPKEITNLTPDKEELALDPEVAVLLPLYMASQLYKDDDVGQSVQFRNEFEIGRELLMFNRVNSMGKEKFVSAWGLY